MEKYHFIKKALLLFLHKKQQGLYSIIIVSNKTT